MKDNMTTCESFKKFGVNSSQFFFVVRRCSALRRPVSVMRHKGGTNIVLVKQVAHKQPPRKPTAAQRATTNTNTFVPFAGTT